VARVQIFAPRGVCTRQNPATGSCVGATEPGVPATYEGRVVTADSAIDRAMAPARQRVHTLQASPLGVSIDAPVSRVGRQGSPLGNIFADALRAAVPDADVAVLNNAARGLWADLPGGPITFGRLYDLFPFDNRIARIALTGAELGRWLAGEIQEGRRGWLGISGIAVRPSCSADGLHVDLVRAAGPIHDEDRLVAVTIAGPTLSGNLASAVFSADVGRSRPLGTGPTANAPVVREAVEDWFRRAGKQAHGHLDRATLQPSDDDGAPAVDCVAKDASAQRGGPPL